MADATILELRPPNGGGRLPPRRHLGDADDPEFYSAGEKAILLHIEGQLDDDERRVFEAGNSELAGESGQRRQLSLPLGELAMGQAMRQEWLRQGIGKIMVASEAEIEERFNATVRYLG